MAVTSLWCDLVRMNEWTRVKEKEIVMDDMHNLEPLPFPLKLLT